MALPYSINWVAASTTFLGALQAPTIDMPLVFTNPVARPNLVTGVAQSPKAVMPQDNVRTVTLTSAGNLSAINFTISAVKENGFVIAQTLAGPNANTVSFTLPASEVFSIIPSGTSATTLSIGISGGYTAPYSHDVWNQATLMSYEISNVVGVVSLTPQITNDLSAKMVNTFYVPQVQSWFPMTPDQVGLVVPIVLPVMFSFREFPVNASRLSAAATTTGTFTLTTLQQGGHW